MDELFSLSGLLVLPLWLLMIALPHWRWTRLVMGSPLVIAAPALLYAALVLPRFAVVFPAVALPSLGVIAPLLGTGEGATIAWAHFLAFDLFVGRWAYLDSRARDISAWVMAPVLFFILMLGPFGFLLYLAVRGAYQVARRQPRPITEEPHHV